MKHLQRMVPYLLPNILAFALLPIILSNTASAMMILLIGLPLIILISAFLYGTKIKKIDALFALAIGILFIPVVVVLMNNTAMPYVVVYAGIALLGNMLGALIKSKE